MVEYARRWGAGSAVRQSVPVRTFADWGNPPPGYSECGPVEHCGGVRKVGNFVHTPGSPPIITPKSLQLAKSKAASRADALGESKLLSPVHAAPATPVSAAAACALGPRQTLPDDFDLLAHVRASSTRFLSAAKAAPPRARTPRQTAPACASHADFIARESPRTRNYSVGSNLWPDRLIRKRRLTEQYDLPNLEDQYQKGQRGGEAEVHELRLATPAGVAAAPLR
jgi:hypothetical protein